MNVFRSMLRRGREEAAMAQELEFHLEQRALDLERSGMTAEQAKRQARVEFGGMEGYKERCREAQGFRFWDELSGDMRFAIRGMRKDLVFTATTVLSLALGIGVNLSCFAALSAMVLHPFLYPE